MKTSATGLYWRC